MIEAAEEEEVFAAGQARVETKIASGVESEIAADRTRVAGNIVAGDFGGALCGKKQRRQDAEQRGFAGAIRAEQSNGFSLRGFQGHTRQGRYGELFEGLEQHPPAGPRRGKGLLEGANKNGRFGHREVIACIRATDNCPQNATNEVVVNRKRPR